MAFPPLSPFPYNAFWSSRTTKSVKKNFWKIIKCSLVYLGFYEVRFLEMRCVHNLSNIDGLYKECVWVKVLLFLKLLALVFLWYFIILSLNISKSGFPPLQPSSPFSKFHLLKGTVNTVMFYFCCFAVWWWWWPQWCVEFIFTVFHEQWHSHLLIYLIIAVLLFCIIVLSNLFKGPDMLWSFKYVPLGLEVVAIWWDSAAWQPFSNWRIQQWNKYDNCKCSVKTYTYHLSFSPWC